MKSPLAPLAAMLLLVASLVAVACKSTSPVTGESSFNILSPSKEASLGLTEFRKIKSSKKISNNATYNAQLQRVGARLAKVMPIENAEWEFVVFEDSTPNAFALPGGKVGVHTGLFQITQNDEGLAAVVGHEVAHVVQRHSGQRLSRGVVSSAAVAGAGILLNQNGQDNKLATAALGAGALVVNQGFSRSQELEADRLGALFMARAGYDPRESVELWKRFAAWRESSGSGGGTPIFLRSHPLDETRIAQLQQYLPTALAEYTPR